MYIKFKKISFSNFMSFGNKEETLDLQNQGMILVTGKNGQGKSSAINDTLSFALYGKPYRKIKINDLINRKNRKKLLVKVEFEIDNNTFIIERGLKPNVLNIYKNGESLDLLSTKNLTQEEIDKIIGIDYDMFKNIIALSLSYNKPFLTLPSQDKRNYIENVFNIKIFSEMLSLIKKDNADLKIKIDINTKALSIMETNMKSLRVNIRNIKNTIESFEHDKNIEIKSINNLIQSILNKIETDTKHFNKLGDLQTLKENLEASNSEKIELTSSITELKYKLKVLKNDIDFYTNNENCPTCGIPIDKKKRDDSLKNKTKESEQIQSNITSIEKKLVTLNNKISKISDQISQYNTLSIQINYSKKELASAEEQLNTVLNRVLSNINIDTLHSELETKSKEYSDLYASFNDDKNTLRINSIIHTILQDDGIKTYFIQQLLPLLNERINHYLNIFEFPLLFSFNERLEENIKSLEHMDHDITYYSFSEGEKKKLDIAVLLSFIDITKRISNWSCNLLCIDELLDSAIDTDGLDNILLCIKEITKETKDLGCYIISHRQIETSMFNRTVSIDKVDGFSTVVMK